MKLKEERKNRLFWLKKLIAAVLVTAAIVLGLEYGAMPEKEVYAAVKNTSVKNLSAGSAKKDPIISLTDKSGRYLTKVKNTWYLKDKNGKALTGVQYVRVVKTPEFQTGYYMFDSRGRLIPKTAVYYFKKQTIGNATFKGYHCTNSKGRFLSSPYGLASLKNLTCKESRGCFHSIRLLLF